MPHLTSIEELDLKESRQEGRQEGQYRTIRRLLERRWGKLPTLVEERLRPLSCDQLDSLAETLLDFQSLADLEA
jgi:hypothetical protein